MQTNHERRRQIIQLRKKGLTRKQIAAQLGISRELVGGYLHQLLKDGSVVPISFEEGIQRRTVTHKVNVRLAKAMRLGGHSYNAIGEHFGVSGATIEKLIGRSVRITRIQRELIELRSRGLTYEEIADFTGKPEGTVAVILARLVKKGLIPEGNKGRRQNGQ